MIQPIRAKPGSISLATDVLFQPGRGEAELDQLDQEVVDGEEQAEGHLSQAGDHLVLAGTGRAGRR